MPGASSPSAHAAHNASPSSRVGAGSPTFISNLSAHPTFDAYPDHNYSPARRLGPRPPKKPSLSTKTLDIETADSGPRLCRAAGRGIAEDIFEALKAGSDPNEVDDTQQSALCRAAGRGHARAVEMLLEAKATPNLADAFGQTPLMIVASSWNREIAELLITAGSDLNAMSTEGLTAVAVAAKCKNIDACKVLAATSNMDDKTRQFLEENGISASSLGDENKDGEDGENHDDDDDDADQQQQKHGSLLFDAVAVQDMAQVRALLESKADVNRSLVTPYVENNDEPQQSRPDTDRATAASQGTGRSIFSTRTSNDDSPTSGDVESNAVTAPESKAEGQPLLDSDGASVVPEGDDSLLYLNIDRPDIVKLLLGAKAEVNVVNAAGMSPLYTACYLGNLEVVDLLLEAKANVHFRHAKNELWTCCAIALATKRQDVLAKLEAAGARLSRVEKTFLEKEFTRAERMQAQAAAHRRAGGDSASPTRRQRRRRSSQFVPPPAIDT